MRTTLTEEYGTTTSTISTTAAITNLLVIEGSLKAFASLSKPYWTTSVVLPVDRSVYYPI